MGAALKLRKRKENQSSCVRVLYKTVNVIISSKVVCLAEEGKEMYQSI